MKKLLLIIALTLLAASSLTATPSIYKSYTDGWMLLGLGVSLSIPDGKFSFLFEFEAGGPEQFGMGVTLMIGDRFRCTLNGFYLLDPTPGSVYSIPIMLKAGILGGEGGGISFGLGLASGIRLYPLAIGPLSTTDGGMHLTGDVEAALYWNFHDFEFSIDAYPGIQFSLVEVGAYYY